MEEAIREWYDRYEGELRALIHAIWEHPETAMEEYETAARVLEFVRAQGFESRAFHAMAPEDPARRPNTVYATWGGGKPVIGILGELDALPGLGNEAAPHRAPLPGAGHGCGHNLIAGCGVGAASALRHAMERLGLPGTVVFVGCPAEERINGKVWLAKAGFFDDLDVCLMWHPFGHAMSFAPTQYAAVSHVLFEFFGKTAHGVFPWEGRSALGAAELMSAGVNYLRHHMTPDCAVDYVYRDAGLVPNVVPEHASAYYYIRSKDQNHEALVERVRKLAEGAATMTETEYRMTRHTTCHGTCPTVSLNRFVAESAQKIPPLEYAREDYDFARRLYEAYFGQSAPEDAEALLPTRLEQMQDWRGTYSRGSTDVGDVSQLAPTFQLEGFGAVTGVSTHKWGMTACTGTAIGEKAAVYVSKIIAQSGLDMLRQPQIIETFWRDFRSFREENRVPPYVPGIYEPE